MKTTLLHGLLATALLSGCASQIDVATDRQKLAAAKPCCDSLARLPAPQPAAAEVAFRLAPDSPHFDFGDGLVPFATVLLDLARTRRVEVASTLHTTTLEAGNQYHFRGVMPRLLFLDADGRRLASDPPNQPAPVLRGSSGQYALSTQVAVPAGARQVVVATNRRTIDSRHGGCIHPGGTGKPVAYGDCIIYPAGVLKVEDWRGAVYGDVRLLAY